MHSSSPYWIYKVMWSTIMHLQRQHTGHNSSAPMAATEHRWTPAVYILHRLQRCSAAADFSVGLRLVFPFDLDDWILLRVKFYIRRPGNSCLYSSLLWSTSMVREHVPDITSRWKLCGQNQPCLSNYQVLCSITAATMLIGIKVYPPSCNN